jgi:Lipopolysaccharide export system permease LptF/LptG
MMPGRLLHRLAARLCSVKTLEHVVEPAIADLQKEYALARTLRAGRARSLIAGYTAILQVIAMCALSVSLVTTDDQQAIARTMAWSFTFTIACTLALMLPPLSIVDGAGISISLAALIPQAVPLAIPIGLTFGIAVGMARRTATRGVTRVILLSALLASIVSFGTTGWIMPAGNQAWREVIAQQTGITAPLVRGPNEMSFAELDRQSAIAAAAGNTRTADSYAWSFHLRFALSAASVVLAGLLIATAIRSAAARALIALLACFTYWVLIFVGEGLAVYSPLAPAFAGTIPVVVGAWLPNIVIAWLAMIIVSSRSSRLRGLLRPAR